MAVSKTTATERAAALTCWVDAVEPVVVSGGTTNANFKVTTQGRSYFVRIGDDIPEHGVLRFNELAASRAAAAAGISPKVVHSEPGALVLEFIDGTTFEPEDIRQSTNLDVVVDLVHKTHHAIAPLLDSPVLTFWVFQVLRTYAKHLEQQSSRMTAQLPTLMQQADILEQAVGPITLVFSHNDLLAANFIRDEQQLWLIDWDYAGFNSPLFDLGGLASNNELDESSERYVLQRYFNHDVDASLWRSYQALKCASLLRESMWSMVSEIHSSIDFDYVAYTEENLQHYRQVYNDFINA